MRGLKRVGIVGTWSLALAVVGCSSDAPTAAEPSAIQAAKGGPKGGGSGGVPVTDLGALPGATFMVAYGVNDGGEVVGIGQGSSGSRRNRTPWTKAFHWQGGVMTDLGLGYAFDISGDGLVAGQDDSVEPGRAVVFERSGGGWTRFVLPTDPTVGPGGGSASGIDDRGDRVVGSLTPHEPDARIPALWTRSGSGWALTILPAGGYRHAYPTDVNDAGVIIGYVGTAPGWRGVVWTNAGSWQMTLLEALPGGPGAPRGEPESRPAGLNETGDLVGISNDADGVDRAVVWRRSGAGWSAPQILGDPKWGDAWGGEISESGRVVGSATTGLTISANQIGFAWDPVTAAITKLTTKGSSAAFAVNEVGQVVGSGFNYERAVMWTLPAP